MLLLVSLLTDKEDMPFDDSAVQKDVDFLAFQKRIKRSPDQIVRYASRTWLLSTTLARLFGVLFV